MRAQIKSLAYWIDTSEALSGALVIMQVASPVLLTLHGIYKSIYYFWAAVAIYVLVFIVLLIQFLYKSRYGTIKLHFKRGDDVLYDLKTKVRNVSLRAKTLQIIFKHLHVHNFGKDRIYEMGYEAGKDFCEDYMDHLICQSKSFKDLKPVEKLGHWLEYDSSSGMGHFEYSGDLQRFPKTLQIKVTNSFLSGMDSVEACEFLSGYMAGVCSKIFKDRKLKIHEVKCAQNSAEGVCLFEIE